MKEKLYSDKNFETLKAGACHWLWTIRSSKRPVTYEELIRVSFWLVLWKLICWKSPKMPSTNSKTRPQTKRSGRCRLDARGRPCATMCDASYLALQGSTVRWSSKHWPGNMGKGRKILPKISFWPSKVTSFWPIFDHWKCSPSNIPCEKGATTAKV